jgi:hypothetical protein
MEAAATGWSIPVPDLRRALLAICWGIAIEGVCNLGTSVELPEGTSSIDIATIAGFAVVLIGLLDLPLDRAPRSIAAPRQTLVVLVLVSLAANVATLAPAVHGAMALAADVTAWTWKLLLLVLVGRIVAFLRAGELARSWRRLAVVWLALATISVGFSAGFSLAFHPAPRSGDGSWQWTVEPNGDHPIWSWFLGAAIVLTVAVLAAAVATVVVAVRSFRWLREVAGTDATRVVRRTSVPIDPDRPGGARLGRDGERLIYYVDKDP